MNKFGPSSPPDKDGHHCPKRPKLSSESRVNLHEQCEHFFIGDEGANQPATGCAVRVNRHDCLDVEGSVWFVVQR